MATRKAPIEGEENARKRQRIDDDIPSSSKADGTPASLFDNLNTDCIVHIISYLLRDDMDSVAVCNPTCREARNNEIFDQTRTGTIVCSEKTTAGSIYRASIRGRWNNAFTGNKTHLKIVGIDKLRGYYVNTALSRRAAAHPLDGVTHLDLSLPEDQTHEVNADCVCAMLRMCPNATNVDLSYMEVSTFRGLCNIWDQCSDTHRLTWKGCKGISIVGMNSPYSTSSVKELFLNGVVFKTTFSLEWANSMYGDEDSERYMFMRCPNLERVSIKNASWNFSQTLPEKLIIKMVRQHPTLCWLRSDLSEENVAMLKEERPEVTFVIE